MKTLKIGLFLSATALLSACASTGEFTPAPLTLKSDNVYTFDDSKSFALNVAEMTNKTSGLRDVEVPQDAQHRISGAETGLALFAGGMSSGIFGLAGMGAIYSDASGARNWRPMYAFAEIPAEQTHDQDFTTSVEVLLDKKLREAFDNPVMGDAEYVGLAYPRRKGAINYQVYLTGSLCNAHLNRDERLSGIGKEFGSYGVFGYIEITGDTCTMGLNVSIEQLVTLGGESYAVVVLEQFSGHYLTKNLAEAFPGYSVMPERFTGWAGITYTNTFPYVTHDGYVHVFSKDIEPFPIDAPSQ